LCPKLAIDGERAHVFWYDAGAQRIEQASFDLQSETWRSEAGLPAPPGLNGYWVCTVSDVLAIALSVDNPEGGDTLSAFRPLPTADPSVLEFIPAQLSESATDESIAKHPLYFESVVGFNQQFAALRRDAGGNAVLQFIGIGRNPTEKTVDLSKLARMSTQQIPGQPLQLLAFPLLLGIVLLMLVTRRDTLLGPISLPPGMAIALALQRLLGMLFDLVPCILIISYLHGLDASNSLRELSGWAFGGRTDSFPASRVLQWWFTCTGIYATYCLSAELLLGRTVGKVIMRTIIISESTRPPAAWQTLVRNLFRVVELTPPFWVLALVVLLSPNRQRVGDVFARTVVVRQARADEQQPPPEGDG
jgi:hypothetical protein